MHGLLRGRGPRLPPRPQSSSDGGRRLFSDKPSGHAGGNGAAAQPSALQRARQATAASSGAFKALTQTAGSTSQKVFGQLPGRVRHWAAGAQQGRLQKAIGLQLEAFWQHHRSKVLAAGGVALVYILWKTMFSVTSIFVNLSETMAELGFLSLSAAIVAFAGLYFRHRFTISPKAVYRQAMIRLNTHPSVLEVMGAPLAGSDVRAQVLTGGGFRLKGLVPKYRSRRLQMIFPLRGAEHRGLVSLEAKRRRGKYDFKLLAVDVPTAAGKDQRLYLAGDDRIYQRGSIIAELRDPFLQALQMQRVYEEEDEADEAQDEADEERERQHREEERAAAAPKPMDQGGGMFFYERVWHGAKSLFSSKPRSAPEAAVQSATVTTPTAATDTPVPTQEQPLPQGKPVKQQ